MRVETIKVVDFTFHSDEINSHKFYTLELAEHTSPRGTTSTYIVRTRWGRIGTDGQMKDYTFSERYMAEVKFKDIQRARLKKGYKRVNELTHEEIRREEFNRMTSDPKEFRKWLQANQLEEVEL